MRQALVTLLKHTWGKDADGGRTVLSTTTVENVFCSVEPGTQDTRVDETGRWVTENNYILRFSTDPGLSTHDEMTWLEVNSSRVHHLVVLGTSNKMGRSATFEVNAIERI